MFLSRIEIDTKNHLKQKEFSHLGAYHNFVETLFPQEFQDGERSRKLWRIDSLKGKKYLLILSNTKPDLKLLERIGVAGTGETKNYDVFLDNLSEKCKYRFRATLNPVVSLSNGKSSGKRGRIVPHVTMEQKINYLTEHAPHYGFDVEKDEVEITATGYGLLRKNSGKPVRVVKTDFEGILTITDKDLFIDTLINGFGKKRAYGCGLITVIPII